MSSIVYQDLPTKIKAFCCEDEEGYKTIILNSRLSLEQNRKSYLHECGHEGDFIDGIDVNNLEKERH